MSPHHRRPGSSRPRPVPASGGCSGGVKPHAAPIVTTSAVRPAGRPARLLPAKTGSPGPVHRETHRGNIAGIQDALVHLAIELDPRFDLDGNPDTVPRLIVAVDEGRAVLRTGTHSTLPGRGASRAGCRSRHHGPNPATSSALTDAVAGP